MGVKAILAGLGLVAVLAAGAAFVVVVGGLAGWLVW